MWNLLLSSHPPYSCNLPFRQCHPLSLTCHPLSCSCHSHSATHCHVPIHKRNMQKMLHRNGLAGLWSLEFRSHLLHNLTSQVVIGTLCWVSGMCMGVGGRRVWGALPQDSLPDQLFTHKHSVASLPCIICSKSHTLHLNRLVVLNISSPADQMQSLDRQKLPTDTVQKHQGWQCKQMGWKPMGVGGNWSEMKCRWKPATTKNPPGTSQEMNMSLMHIKDMMHIIVATPPRLTAMPGLLNVRSSAPAHLLWMHA